MAGKLASYFNVHIVGVRGRHEETFIMNPGGFSVDKYTKLIIDSLSFTTANNNTYYIRHTILPSLLFNMKFTNLITVLLLVELLK